MVWLIPIEGLGNKMPSFEKLFNDAKIGEPVLYQGTQIIRKDRFLVENGEVLICSIESTNSTSGFLQGFCIDITGHCELDGNIHKIGKGVRMVFWDGFSPKEIKLKVFTKIAFVVVYNICEVDVSYLSNDENGNPLERHSKRVDYANEGAAMIVEEIEGGKRYRCSDTSSVDKEDQFSDIVFTIKKVNK